MVYFGAHFWTNPGSNIFFLSGFGLSDPKLCGNDILNRFIYYGMPKSSSSTIGPVCRSQVGTKNLLVLELISRLYMVLLYKTSASGSNFLMFKYIIATRYLKIAHACSNVSFIIFLFSENFLINRARRNVISIFITFINLRNSFETSKYTNQTDLFNIAWIYFRAKLITVIIIEVRKSN